MIKLAESKENQQLIIFAELLKIQAQLFGMQSENTMREYLGQSMAYNEDNFHAVANKIDITLGKILNEQHK